MLLKRLGSFPLGNSSPVSPSLNVLLGWGFIYNTFLFSPLKPKIAKYFRENRRDYVMNVFSSYHTLVNILMGGYYSIVCLSFLTLTQIWFTIWIYFLKSLFMNICKTLNTNCQTTFREFIATYNPIKGLFIVHIAAPLPLLKTKNFKSSLFFFNLPFYYY